MLQLRNLEGIEILSIPRDESKLPSTSPKQKQRIKHKILIDFTRTLARSFHQNRLTENLLCIRKYAQFLSNQIHFIGQVPYLLINIESLTSKNHHMLIMTLELKIVP